MNQSCLDYTFLDHWLGGVAVWVWTREDSFQVNVIFVYQAKSPIFKYLKILLNISLKVWILGLHLNFQRKTLFPMSLLECQSHKPALPKFVEFIQIAFDDSSYYFFNNRDFAVKSMKRISVLILLSDAWTVVLVSFLFLLWDCSWKKENICKQKKL